MSQYIITWIGHSCFSVEKDGYKVVFDPSEDGYVPGISPIREEANLVICSHEHGDHNARGLVKIVEDGDRVPPYIITEIETYHDDQKGALRGENLITILDDGEVRIAHFGDLGCIPDDEVMSELMDLDIVMIPVGGYYTIDGETAAEIVKAIKPKLVIPMHYKDEALGFGFDIISSLEPFESSMEGLERLSSSELVYEPSEDGGTKVVALIPRNHETVE